MPRVHCLNGQVLWISSARKHKRLRQLLKQKVHCLVNLPGAHCVGHRSPLGFSVREGSSGALPAPRNLQGEEVALLKWTAKGKCSLSHLPHIHWLGVLLSSWQFCILKFAGHDMPSASGGWGPPVHEHRVSSPVSKVKMPVTFLLCGHRFLRSPVPAPEGLRVGAAASLWGWNCTCSRGPGVASCSLAPGPPPHLCPLSQRQVSPHRDVRCTGKWRENTSHWCVKKSQLGEWEIPHLLAQSMCQALFQHFTDYSGNPAAPSRGGSH